MGYLKISIRDDFSGALMKKLSQAGPRAAHALANQIAKDTEPFVPASGSQAGLYNRVQVVDGTIIYPGPYARYLYHGKVMVFKDPPYLRTINGKEVLSHYGQHKHPIERPLEIKTHHHKDATDHWFEASKSMNMDKWTRVARRLVKDELDQ